MAEKNKFVDINLNQQRHKNSQYETAVPAFDGHETRSLLERLVRLSGVVKSYLFRGDSIGLLGDVDVTTNAPVVGDRMRFDGTNWVPTKNTHIIPIAGRFDLFLNGNWSSWSDPNFGPNLQDWDANLGANATPNIDWDGMGMLLPAGTKLIRLIHKVRANSNDVDSVEFFARVHDVDLTTGAAIDTNAEVGATTVLPVTTINLDGGPVQANDLQIIEHDLGGYVMQNDGDFHYVARAATGSITANRQLRGTLFLEVEYP